MNEIVMVDIIWNGHVPTYHKYFAQVLLEQGYNVLSISPDPEDVLRWINDNIPNLSHNLKCAPFDSSDSNGTTFGNRHIAHLKFALRYIITHCKIPAFIRTFLNYFVALRLWKKTDGVVVRYIKQYNLSNAAIIFFPYIDYKFLNQWLTRGLVERFFHFRWAALYLHPTHMRKNPNYKRLLFCPDSIFFSNNCIGISILDEALIAPLRSRIKKPVLWFPDITDNNINEGQLPALHKSILERAQERKIIALLGALSKKKNLITLLKVAELCLEKQFPYFFVFAGELFLNSWEKAERHQILSAIEKKSNNMFFHLHNSPDGPEYNSFYVISDIIFAVYNSSYHSSNTLTKAAFFERPVIVSEGNLMAERVKKYRSGLAIPGDNIAKCLEAMNCITNKTDYDGFPLQPKFNEYREMHSKDTLHRAFAELLDKSY